MLATASDPIPSPGEELQARIHSMQASRLNEHSLPTLPALQRLLQSDLRQGITYSIKGSTSLALALLAGPSAQGIWCGALGMPNLGTEAAQRLGIELDRLVLVPNPGNRWLTVAAAMTDVLGVVIARAPQRVTPADTSRLGARLRQRGSTLIVLGEWPGADVTLTVAGSIWQGLGTGYGCLTTRHLEIEVSGRNNLRQPRSQPITFPPEAPQKYDMPRFEIVG